MQKRGAIVRVVVTGSAGFIGRHLITRLVSQGHQVTGLDRQPSAGDGLHQYLRCELTELGDEAREPLTCANAVIHLAGCPGVRDTAPHVEARRYRDNVAAVREVLSIVPTGVPVVVASSSSVYGGSLAGRPSAEHDVLAPRGGYARSKVMAEELCNKANKRGARVTVVRPFTVVGEGQRRDMALHRWLVAALNGQPLTILGPLDRTRDLADVHDVTNALINLVEAAPGEVVNLGSGHPTSLTAMVRTVGEVTHTTPILRRVPASLDEVPHTLADVRKMVQITRRHPATDLHDVVTRMYHDVQRREATPRVRRRD
jgi:nucleoside-diphosphate-sugar epimerase